MVVVLGALFALVFAVIFFSVIASFWRVRGMTNRIFTLAEQELERKLREGSLANSATPGSASDSPVCSHCGRRVTANVPQCPNCGAGLS